MTTFESFLKSCILKKSRESKTFSGIVVDKQWLNKKKQPRKYNESDIFMYKILYRANLISLIVLPNLNA